jgi:hypothetical protein
MAATPAVMQQLQKTGTTYIPGGLPPNSGGAPPQLVKPSVSPIQGGLPPVMPTPAPSTPQIGSEQSLTPGQIIFTEYQARVFNQTEAMYKTSGFLGISLFEDSYLLSKATANYIVGNIGLSGTVDSINPSAGQTYRAVLGIPNPVAPPPVAPTPTVSPVTPVKPTPTVPQVAVTPTVFTPPANIPVPPQVSPTSPVKGGGSSSLPTSVSNEIKNSTSITTAGSAFSPLGGGSSNGGSKIICNELYRQGYLSEQMWDADERYGEMMFEKDPKLVIGYQMWARSVVKYMRKNPNNTKMAAWLFKPWTEYMGYKMGVVEKPTLRGRFTNWIGTQFSYAVFNLYNGKRLLDKYNYKVFKSENNIGEYKIA